MFLFVDLNSYFATVEQQANPALRGKPVGVCEHSGGIILAASTEAKLLGIKTGTPTWEAKKICPQIVLLPVDPAKIRASTSRFYRIAEDYSDNVEHVSVDEVAIKLFNPPSSVRPGGRTSADFAAFCDAIKVAKEIKQRIKVEMGEWITCSIGIGESRLLAKIGTNLQKPDGLVVISDVGHQNAPDVRHLQFQEAKLFTKAQLYETLELEDIPGIGSRLGRSLRAKGITSLKQLAQTSAHKLRDWYGIHGLWLHDLANFRDAWKDIDLDGRPVKSIGHQYALGKRNALYEKTKIEGLFWKLAEKVTERLRAANFVASTVSVYIGYVRPPFYPPSIFRGQTSNPQGGLTPITSKSGIGGSHKTQDFFDDTPSVVKVAEKILADKWGQTSSPRGGLTPKLAVSFVSISVSGLVPKQQQGLLFEKDKLKRQIPQVVDKINQRHGDFAVKYAPTMEVQDLAGDTVGFGRTRERKDWQEE